MSVRRMVAALFLAASVAIGLFEAGSARAGATAALAPALRAAISGAQPTQQLSVIVMLKTQENVRALSGRTRGARQRAVIRALRRRADGDQASLRTQLAQLRAQGHVASFKPLWVINALVVTGDSSAINQLAQSPDVAAISLDATIQAPPRSAQASSPPQSNLSAINAPAVWALGDQGQGAVVANMDTGVDYTHPDLASSWRGGINSWFDPYGQHATPTDLNGHGTWTMGVMVGGDSSGAVIGVAPAAKWIAVKIFNDSGTATFSAIHQGYQWLLDPDGNPSTDDAPYVVNNSWDYSNVNGCDLAFEPDLESLAAAGIASVFAAGNFGSNGSTSVSPANNPAAFAVGGVDNSGLSDIGSSRGPTSCGGAPRTFPDVVAPDVNINTTDLYGLYYGVTGTSLAAPHVSGALALLLSSYPNLTVDQQRSALVSTAADLGPVGSDNTFGAGRLDVLAAYNSLTSGGSQTPTATATSTSTSDPAATATSTPTATATSTSTSTSTATATSTSTSTPTATATSTSTGTATSTATRTTTNTPTRTATSTATRTATSTATSTAVSDLVFADGFESGSLTAWSATGGMTSAISAAAAARQAGSYGLATTINSSNSGYIQDNTPSAESSYHARFYFNPNNFGSTSTTARTIFTALNAANQTIFTLQARRQSGGAYQVSASVARSGGTTTTSWFTVSSSAFTALEVAWQAGGSASFSFSTGGLVRQTLTNLNTNGRVVDTVRLGPQGSLSGVTGTLYFDSFASTRTSSIGL